MNEINQLINEIKEKFIYDSLYLDVAIWACRHVCISYQHAL